uniref:PIH1D1/2/3 CS-like domain-containing protein n=1 Tax=Scylla olivacea TaxID=85551 RepID=A0A0P4WGE4_SCYOL
MSTSELDVQALAALLYPRGEEEDDYEEQSPTKSVTPADLGTNSFKVKQDQHFRQPATDTPGLSSMTHEDAWKEELDDSIISDPRPQPQYEVTFRERVTPSQVCLPISMGKTGEEDIVVRVELPGELLTEVTLEVTSTTLNLASPTYYLHLPLPRPVNQRRGVATWDPTAHTLVVTLPTVHGTALLQPSTK